jgi:2-dehydro-3-deoxy-D-arabinonate dehydratase
MMIVRFTPAGSDAARVGVLQDGAITEVTGVATLADLWQRSAAEIRACLTAAACAGSPRHELAAAAILPPIDGRCEVWAAGVTYQISRQARVADSLRAQNVYDQVYDAARPELFFKSAAWRAVGAGEPIAIRSDSGLDVPEPELAVVLNARGEAVGYTICNDVSSRTIEGENPLYLPQAKVYLGGCAIGPAIRPAWEIPDPYTLHIEMVISRDGTPAWSGSASTSAMRRRIDTLTEFLFRADAFPDGVLLSTGTCLVPEPPFTLEAGDVVTIGIAGLGQLTNPVVRGRADMMWVTTAGTGRRGIAASTLLAGQPQR